MKIVAIIQARMGSTRLPGKVMCHLAGQPMVVREINRLRRAESIEEIAVATTDRTADDAIDSVCRELGVKCFRGSENDVLDRYYQATRAHGAEAVVRITGDCPFIEPEIVGQVVRAFREAQPLTQYASNIFPNRTYPRGLDTEVIRFDALEQAWREASEPASREHVTPYIHKNASLFHILSITNDTNLSSMRWTVDTDEDFEFASVVYQHFGSDLFSWKEMISLLSYNPSWRKINEYVRQKGSSGAKSY